MQHHRLAFALIVTAAAGCTGSNLPGLDQDMAVPDLAPDPCRNLKQDGEETATDCGGPTCMPCETGDACKKGRDCASGFCTNLQCDPPSCTDGVTNGSETDKDCGGTCPTCDLGQACNSGTDCASKTCTNSVCVAGACTNGRQDGMETDVDCGGPACSPCTDGRVCTQGTDCLSMTCTNNKCRGGLSCAAPLANCDGDDSNGCEVNTDSDQKNCGQCGRACPLAMATCVGGACVAACTQGITFAKVALYGTGAAPRGITAADWNGDGRLDLAVTCNEANTVSLLLNQGNGTFGPNADYPVGQRPWSIAAGDLDGDGRPEAIVTNPSDSTVSVLPGQQGGTLGPQVTYDTEQQPFGLAVGDLDGDRKLDVLTGGHSNPSMSLLLNDGKGGLRPHVGVSGGLYANSPAIADFDGDGKPDIAASAEGDNDIDVLLSRGGGLFAARANYWTMGSIGIATGDIDGDGRPDIVTGGGRTVAFLVNAKGKGFNPVVTYITGGQPTNLGVRLGDLDRDGRPEIVTANDGMTMSILVNKGAGAFAPHLDFALPGGANGLALADLDGDGKLDVAITDPSNKAVAVYLNRCK